AWLNGVFRCMTSSPPKNNPSPYGRPLEEQADHHLATPEGATADGTEAKTLIAGRQFHFRMPKPMARQFDVIRSDFPSLPTPVLLRLLLAATLNKPMSAQVRAVQ